MIKGWDESGRRQKKTSESTRRGICIGDDSILNPATKDQTSDERAT